MKFFRFLLFIILTACSGPADKPASSAVATGSGSQVLVTVGNATITVDAFTEYAAMRRTPDTPEARAAVLEEMVNEECLVQRALAAKLDQTPEYRRAMRQFLITRLDEQELQPSLAKASEISEGELAAAMAEAPQRILTPPGRRYAWIRLKANTAESEAARLRLTEAAEKYRTQATSARGNGFGSLAVEYSDDDDTRYQGGDLGWMDTQALSAKLPSNAADVVSKLTVGQSTDPLALPDGWCLVTLSAERAAVQASTATIKEKLRNQLMLERRAAAERNYHSASRSNLTVTYHEAPPALGPAASQNQPKAPTPPESP